tara:strand:+ start:902 stop:1537 length:636 start_codon:yes stop_codon:yes gene_type:complete
MPFFGIKQMGVIRVELCVNNVNDMLVYFLRKKTLPATILNLDKSEEGNFWKFVEELETSYNKMREEAGPYLVVCQNDFKSWMKTNYTKMKTWVAVKIEITYSQLLVERRAHICDNPSCDVVLENDYWEAFKDDGKVMCCSGCEEDEEEEVVRRECFKCNKTYYDVEYSCCCGKCCSYCRESDEVINPYCYDSSEKCSCGECVPPIEDITTE